MGWPNIGHLTTGDNSPILGLVKQVFSTGIKERPWGVRDLETGKITFYRKLGWALRAAKGAK